MAILEIEGRTFDVDGDGFLSDPYIWDEDVARLIAKSDGIDSMNEKHWSIVNIIRKQRGIKMDYLFCFAPRGVEYNP